MDLAPLRFIEEQVETLFDIPPLIEKSPPCPNGFVWRGITYRVAAMLAEWRDYERRGRFARNMQPQHAVTAARRGSWGVGLFYFRVKTDTGQIFDLYFDRAPKDASNRKGAWFLYRELAPPPGESL